MAKPGVNFYGNQAEHDENFWESFHGVSGNVKDQYTGGKIVDLNKIDGASIGLKEKDNSGCGTGC